MKKVTAFVGAARKKHTYEAVQVFLSDLEALGDVESEIVRLGDYHLETCRGCKRCFGKGEEHCPFKDDRDLLIQKLDASDGVVFASPNYSFQVSGLMKAFLDRLGYLFHRPRFHGKTFTSIVTQGIHGGDKIVEYLDFVGWGLGFSVVKGTCHTAFEEMTEKERLKWDTALAEQARRFHERLLGPSYPGPTLFGLLAFRMGRTSIRLTLGENDRDYTYYREKGWFESDYWYPTRLDMPKWAAGKVLDRAAAVIYGSGRSGQVGG